MIGCPGQGVKRTQIAGPRHRQSRSNSGPYQPLFFDRGISR